MNEECDYSSYYRYVCTVEVSIVANLIRIQRSDNRAFKSTLAPYTYYQMAPADFFYNEENGDIIFGNIMQSHYKKHPPKKRYLHVANFLDALHQMYKSQCYNDTLYSAIVSFLTKILPQKLREENDRLTRTQYIWILPEEFSHDPNFVSTTFRPTLEEASWLSPSDRPIKLLISSHWECFIQSYQCRQQLRLYRLSLLQRERKYILCDIQKMANQDKFLATLQTAQMVYDPDLISASNGSLTTLGKKYLLAPKTLNTSASIEIPFNCSLGKMKKLAKFVFLNIFAASEDDTIGNDTVEDYYCGNKHYTGRFMLDFMENILLENFMQGGTVRLQSLKFFEEVCWPKHNINEIQKEKILNMEYQDIIDIFDDIDFSAIMNSIDEFLRANFEKTNISEVIINTDNLTYYGMFHHPGEHYRKNIRAYILDYCSDFHLNFLRKKLLECIRGLNCGYGKLHAFTDIFHLINGCLYKDFKMTELANKIGKPIVVDTTCSRASEPENHANLSLQETNAKHLIDIIQPYSYYAEVIVSKNCMLDMSLKQVIETTTTDGALEKSTLSVSDKSIQMDDFFCAICDNLWFSISIQDANLTITDYVYFKSKITAYVKTFLFGESKQTVDLDANVNFGPRLPCETYALNISPRTIMEIGIAPCLDTILSVIITSLKDKECFGRYQPTIAFISGDLLYQLIYESHPAYSKYIWMHLIATLASQTYVKQLKTNILLTKNYIYSHHSLGYTTLEWKKYQQVYKKSLFVKIEHIHGPEAQVYIDRGDYLENVPSNKIGSRDTWTIPLTKGKHDPVSQNGLKEAIYVHLKNFSTLTSKSSSERMLYDILFIYNNVEEEEQHEIIKNTQENVVMHALFTNDIYTDEENRKRSSFPLEILVLPFNDVSAINLYSGMGLDMLSDSYQTYNSVSIPERLTVKRI